MVPPRLGLSSTSEILEAQAFLVMGVRDPRGIRNDPEVHINQGTQRFVTGTSIAELLGGNGVHLPMGTVDINAGASFNFSFPLQLTGSEHLARNFEYALADNQQEALGLSFIEPVNVYLKSERAVKYGVLFVALTFGAFFIVEIMRRLPIHPLQYFLVGSALAIFFLLLMALSEHIDFVWAYGISATACVLLVGIYLSGVFNDFRRGLVFGAGYAGLIV
jgi:inner membrane protein